MFIFLAKYRKKIVYVYVRDNVYVRKNVSKHSINSSFRFNPSSGNQYVPIHSRVAIIGVWDTVNTLKCRQAWCTVD